MRSSIQRRHQQGSGAYRVHERMALHMFGFLGQVRTYLTTRFVFLIVFWIAFVSFLATSIPHIAWLWDLYEPADNLPMLIVSYGVAISFDVTICLLAYVLVSGRQKRDRAVAWLFITALSLLSWYANFLYDSAHAPRMPLGWLTPFIVSAVPIFALAYTFMSSRVQQAVEPSLVPETRKLVRQARSQPVVPKQEVPVPITQRKPVRRRKKALTSAVE